MNRRASHTAALGGVTAALAVVIMSLGTVIPIATYLCPMLAIVLLHVYFRLCGTRAAWAWYGAVALLSALLAPDKEAAAVFVFLGYYPIVKPWLEGGKLALLWKALLFNTAVLVMYWLLIHVLGLDRAAEEFAELGAVMTAVMLVMGNITFFLVDRMLTLVDLRFQRRKKAG